MVQSALLDSVGQEFASPLLYLALQLTKNKACRNIFIDRKLSSLILNLAEECINDVVVSRTCMAILMHLHDPTVLDDVSCWLKPSKCDDLEVHIYVALCVWRSLLVHPTCRELNNFMVFVN